VIFKAITDRLEIRPKFSRTCMLKHGRWILHGEKYQVREKDKEKKGTFVWNVWRLRLD